MPVLLKKILGIDPNAEPVELENTITHHFIFHYIGLVALFVILVVFSILTRQINTFLTGTFILLILFGMDSISHINILYGNVEVIEGPCQCTDRKVYSVLRQKVFGKAEIIIRCDDGNIYSVPLFRATAYDRGTRVRVYADKTAIYQKDNDTFMIPNPIYVMKVKNAPDDSESSAPAADVLSVTSGKKTKEGS